MTTWVLLRGLARESRHWGTFPIRLSRRLGDAPVLPVDLPGNGILHGERSPANVRGFVQSCMTELARMRARPPYRLVALSLGGMVALDACYARPDLFEGAVLINSSMRGYGKLWERLKPTQWARIAALLASPSSIRSRERAVLRMTSGRPEAHGEDLARWEAIAREHPISRANAIGQIVAAARYAPPDAPPPVPVLLLASAGDALVAPVCSQRFADRWSLPIRSHAWAGHDLPLDDPEWVIDQVAQWAAGLCHRRAGGHSSIREFRSLPPA